MNYIDRPDQDSNLGPYGHNSAALPTELWDFLSIDGNKKVYEFTVRDWLDDIIFLNIK